MTTIKTVSFVWKKCLTKITKVRIAVKPLKEEKKGGEEWLKELLGAMLELLGKTGKAEASLLHHLAPAGTMSVSEET